MPEGKYCSYYNSNLLNTLMEQYNANTENMDRIPCISEVKQEHMFWYIHMKVHDHGGLKEKLCDANQKSLPS